MHHFNELFCLPSYALSISVLASVFFAGILGGFVHCSSMCGGFGISFATYKYTKILPKNFNEKTRLLASLILPYHAGRITTYAFLGFISAYFSSLISSFDMFKYVRFIVLFLALVMFISASFKLGLLESKINANRFANYLGKISGKFFNKPDGLNLYISGVILGFLPCSMVYSALLMAIASGSPLIGSLLVVAFGLGTIFPLVLTAYGLGYFVKKIRGSFNKISPIIMALNSIIIVYVVYKL